MTLYVNCLNPVRISEYFLLLILIVKNTPSGKTGDFTKVRKLINAQTVNSRDSAGRKSTPLHFAAGK